MVNLIPADNQGAKTRWLLLTAIIFFIIFLVAGLGLILFDAKYQDVIYPNIYAGPVRLGGLKAEEAKRLINREIDKINQKGVNFSYKNNQLALTPLISSSDGDLALELIGFNVDRVVLEAVNYGRQGNYFNNLIAKADLLARPKNLLVPVSLNRNKIVDLLKDNFTQAYEPARDAQLIVKKSPLIEDYEFTVNEERSGKVIDYEEALSRLMSNLTNLDSSEIKLATVTQHPKILFKDALNIETQARKILEAAPLTLTYGDKTWALNKDELSRLLSLKPSISPGPKVKVGLDNAKFKDYLLKNISPLVDKPPLEAKFEINGGKVSEFQNGQDGLAINPDLSLEKIEREMIKGQPIELIVEAQPALVKTSNINSFGIKEVVGVGVSNFTGSPPNRRHNIKVGGASLNGLLIKPGEEFSLLKALGKVDGQAGYLPELVIKENKTIPEYGGGLCQVGTTMFRAALESGLPITMRRNHSYRVQYYEPAGTDATIYDPSPDFRFINDMAAYILIQTRIEGDNLMFEFWGTKDGRVVEKTKPTIYNIVKPGPTKIVETLNLKPGEKKCTEKAHNGADAYFDYKVTYASGEIKEKKFSSHYVPWREVCLIGVEKLSAPENGAATSTPAI